MSMFVVRGRLDRQVAHDGPANLDFDQMLADGSIHDQLVGGMRNVEAMPFGSVGVDSIINSMERNNNASRGTRV